MRPFAVAAAGVKGPEPRDLAVPDLNELVVLHGVLMGGTLWDTAVAGLGDRYRCIVLELPFGAHTTPIPDDTDLSLPALATTSPGSSPNWTSTRSQRSATTGAARSSPSALALRSWRQPDPGLLLGLRQPSARAGGPAAVTVGPDVAATCGVARPP